MSYVLPFSEIGIHNIPEVGGKNASLGEMYSQLSSVGIKVPNGYATTAEAYHYFIEKIIYMKKLPPPWMSWMRMM